MTTAADELVHDALIVGGGHAGLSAALTLYRAQLKTVVFDTGRPRNRWNTPVRLMPTWESTTPQEQIEASRKELAKTGFVRFVDAAIVTISKVEAGGDDDGKTNSTCFRAVDGTGQPWLGRKLLLAVGSSNVFPSMDGYESNFAKHMYVAWRFVLILLRTIYEFSYLHRIQLPLHVPIWIRTAWSIVSRSAGDPGPHRSADGLGARR